MNCKTLILTLALCLCIVPFVNAAHDYYPENKIVANDPSLLVPNPNTYGYVEFAILAGGAQDKIVWVANKENPDSKVFDCKFNPDKSDITGQNPGYEQVKVPGVGTTGILQWQTGKFVSYVQNGNGNQCEKKEFEVIGASSSQATRVIFQGAAVSMLGNADAPSPSVTPDPKCHTHTVSYPIFEWVKHCTQKGCHWEWKIVRWDTYTWECCKKHCDIGSNPN